MPKEPVGIRVFACEVIERPDEDAIGRQRHLARSFRSFRLLAPSTGLRLRSGSQWRAEDDGDQAASAHLYHEEGSRIVTESSHSSPALKQGMNGSRA